MAVVSVKGAAKVIRVYNVSRMEIEGLDLSEFDLESAEDVRELFDLVNDFVETGEVEAFEPPVELNGVDPDECTIEIEGKRYTSDEVTLWNENIVELLSNIQEAKVGDLFYIRSLEGDGLWDIDSDAEHIEPSKLALGYVDCSVMFDQYDVLREGYLDIICDTILPEHIRYEDARFELKDFVFHPVQIYGQLYVVVKDPVEDVKFLQKVDFGGRLLAGTDFIVDDFEAN